MWYLSSVYLTQRKHPSYVDSSEYSNYGKDFLYILLHQYGLPRIALSLDGKEFQKQALITDNVMLNGVHFVIT